MNYEHQGLGYRRDLEQVELLRSCAQLADTFYCGDIDPKALAEPIGMAKVLHLENQGQMNSCVGNSITTVTEGCLWHQSQGQVNVQLSRMWAYVHGQQFGNPPLYGDCGANLRGCIKAAQTVGICLEKSAGYTGFYYTNFLQAAVQEAKQYLLGAYLPITHVDQVYEGLAKRIGGAYFGMNWTGQFQQPLAGGMVDSYHENQPGWNGQIPGGFHAVCFMDWSSHKDSQGYPRLDLFNSHGSQYGDNGISHWSRAAVQSAIEQPNTLAFFLSDMKFIKPRFDFSKQHWTSV